MCIPLYSIFIPLYVISIPSYLICISINLTSFFSKPSYHLCTLARPTRPRGSCLHRAGRYRKKPHWRCICYGLGLFAINPAALRCGSDTGLSRSLAFVIDFDEFRFKIENFAIQSSIVFEESVLTFTLARPSPGSQRFFFRRLETSR